MSKRARSHFYEIFNNQPVKYTVAFEIILISGYNVIFIGKYCISSFRTVAFFFSLCSSISALFNLPILSMRLKSVQLIPLMALNSLFSTIEFVLLMMIECHPKTIQIQFQVYGLKSFLLNK